MEQVTSRPLYPKPGENAELYGEADCIDCGQRTPRRLPERFPHICSACLFVPDLEASLAERSKNRSWTQQLAELHAAVVHTRRFDQPFGQELRTGIKAYDVKP